MKKYRFVKNAKKIVSVVIMKRVFATVVQYIAKTYAEKPKERKNFTATGLLSTDLYIDKNIPTAEVNENNEMIPIIYFLKLFICKKDFIFLSVFKQNMF